MFALTLGTWFALLFALPSSAQRNIELSAPLEREPLGEIGAFSVNPEGTHCLYGADPGRIGRVLLRRAALVGGPSQEFGPGAGGIERGGRVFWITPLEEGGELRTRLADGSDAGHVLSAPLALGEAIVSFEVSPDGKRVLYRAGPTSNQRNELYSVASQGGPVVKVNAPLGQGGMVERDVAFGPDGQSVYFRARLRDDQSELYRGTIDGRQPVTRLCAEHGRGRTVTAFALAQEGTRIVYRADSRLNNTFELFVAPTDGSTAPRILGPAPVTGGDVVLFEVTPDGKRVLVTVDAIERGRFELWSVEIASGAYRRLHPALPTSAGVLSIRLTEDGQTVVFLANPDDRLNQELFVAPVDGNTPARRLVDLALGEAVRPGWAVRGGRATYVRRIGLSGPYHVESVALDGTSPPIDLSGQLPSEPSLLVGSTRAVFSTSLGRVSVPSDGSAPPVALDEFFDAFLVEPGELLLGRAGGSTHIDLFAQPADGSVSSYQVSAPFPRLHFNEEVEWVALSPRGDLALYDTRPASGGLRTFVADVHGRGASMFPESESFQVSFAAFTRDGERVVHYRPDGSLVVRDLDSASVPTVLLGGVRDFAFAGAADLALVVQEDANGARHALAVPFDGSPAVLLDPILPSGFTIVEFFMRVSDDGRFGVLSLGSLDDPVLYRMALDGSVPAERLNSSSLGLDPLFDGTRIAFAEQQGKLRFTSLKPGAPVPSVIQPFDHLDLDAGGGRLIGLGSGELFAVDSDGTILDLDQEVVEYVAWFLPVPGGERILIVEPFQAQTDGWLFHLWSAPLDGSSLPVRLDPVGAGPAGFFIRNVPGPIPAAATPDGAHVVFATPEGILRMPMDGSGAPELLVTASELGGNFPSFHFTPDSQSVLFVREGLFEVPLSGARPPVRIDTPGPYSSSLRNVLPLPDGRGVLYTARQEGDGNQLFLGLLERFVRPGPR